MSASGPELRPVGRVDLAGVGIAAAELAERANHRPASVTAAELTRWLLEERLAVEHGGLLRPTERGLELGQAVTP